MLKTYPCKPNPPHSWLWDLTKATVTIFPILPIFGAVGLLVAALGTWKAEKFTFKIKSPLTWGLALITVWLIITSCLGKYPLDAWLGLANFLPSFLIFIFFSHIVTTISQLRQLAWRLVLPSVAVVLLGLGQIEDGWETPYHILLDEIVPYGRPQGRMSSLFMYANILAAYLLVMFILGLGLWIDTYIRAKQGKQKIKAWQLGFLGFVVCADGVGLVLTDSRNAWALAFLAALVFAFYCGWRALAAGFVALGGVISLASWGPGGLREFLRTIVPGFIWLRLSDQVYQDRRPLPTLRTSQWQFAWEKMTERPWVGWGLRSFTPLYKEKTGIWLGHPHNLYLMLGSETGMIGLGLFLVWVGWIMAQGMRLCLTFQEDALILFTYLLAFTGCIFFNTLDVTVLDGKLNVINWIILGAIAGTVFRGKTAL
jgi:O-antigen ligase